MKGRTVGGLLLVTLLTGCAAGRIPAASTPSGSRPLRPDASDVPPVPVVVPWSDARPLVWSDFLATAPTDGVEGAHTVYELSYQSRCHGADFRFEVRAVFLPERSWVKPSVLASRFESERILRHEQTHFNLTEVHARRMRRYFAQVYDPCGQSEAQVKDTVDRFVREEAVAQQHYDAGTTFGLAPDEQRTWDRDVREWLSSLSDFAASDGAGRGVGPRDAGASRPASRSRK